MKMWDSHIAISLILLVLGPLAAGGQEGGVGAQALKISAEWNEDLNPRENLQWLETTARRLEERLAEADPGLRVEVMNRYLFEELGFRVRRELESPDFLFLDRVIDRKAGYCVGLATLYLALGERVGLPLHAVAAPGHVFVRYDDGTVRRNIELTERGRELSDGEYVQRFRIPEESIERGVFLRNLSSREFLAQILNNHGVLSSQRGDYRAALEDYRRALRLDPLFQAVYYNRGNDWVLQGKFRKARRDLTRAIRMNPNDAEAWNNRGVCFLKMGRWEKARRDFEEALSVQPGFERAEENLRRLQRESGTRIRRGPAGGERGIEMPSPSMSGGLSGG